MKEIKNLPASVRQRLMNEARKEKRPYDELVRYYAMERFLFRLSESVFSRQYILKGGLLLKLWDSSKTRSTMDIDMKGVASNHEQEVLNQIERILSHPVVPDGIIFDPSSLKVESITDDSEYSGLRIKFLGFIGTQRIPMQLDIGFGDVITPEPIVLEYPTILDFPEPKIFCYNMESVIAEKFEAMISLGRINSRMKDFYDIWLLASQNHFDFHSLETAIEATLRNRGTRIPEDLNVFSEGFITSKQAQWEAYKKRTKLDTVPLEFAVIVRLISCFLTPIVEHLIYDSIYYVKLHWVPTDGWMDA